MRKPPVELLDALRQRWMRKSAAALKQDRGREQMFRTLMQRYHGPSARAKAASHPIGAAAQAVRDALLEFREYRLEVEQVIQSMLAGGGSVPLPEALAEGRRGRS